MFGNGGGGKFYWVRNQTSGVVRGIVVVFAWVSIKESRLRNYTDLYSSLGWNSLVCVADFLNPVFPDRSVSLAFSLLNALVEELRIRPCPIVLSAFSGGSKACMYKFVQIIEGAGEVQIKLDGAGLVRDCISGHIYDSGPVDFKRDLGARFILHPTLFKLPGSDKLVSLIAKAVASGVDALFFSRLGTYSHRSQYWQTLYSSVNLGGPFLVVCSENDELAPYPVVLNFVQRIERLGGHVKLVKFDGSPHVGHYEHYPIQYRSAVSELLEQAVSIYSQKIQGLGERSYIKGVHDEISDLICDLQNAALNSSQSFGRIAQGPEDQLPNSAECGNYREFPNEQKEGSVHLSDPPKMNAHTLLGEILFDACVPKNIEGWDIKFGGSLNGHPFASACKHSLSNGIKCIRRSRL